MTLSTVRTATTLLDQRTVRDEPGHLPTTPLGIPMTTVLPSTPFSVAAARASPAPGEPALRGPSWVGRRRIFPRDLAFRCSRADFGAGGEDALSTSLDDTLRPIMLGPSTCTQIRYTA
jgi:hypothetical protein